MFKKMLFASLVAAGTLAGNANAFPLTGTFNIDIYNFNAGGTAANANADAATVAAVAAVAANVGNFVASITYTGALWFMTSGSPQPTIEEFLDTGGGTYDDTGLSILMTAGGFTTTTLFDITAIRVPMAGVINHDDGITTYDDGILNANSPGPVSSTFTNFAHNGGAFRLIYSAANGNPEILKVDLTSIPEPATLGLLGLGLAGLGVAKRRRKTA